MNKAWWMPVPGYEKYIVSIGGQVFSTHSQKLLKLRPTNKGYHSVSLDKKTKRTALVHRLVMLAFVGPSTLQVNHKNGVRTDNRIDNLEYCTNSENNLHSFRVLGRKSHMIGKFGPRHHRSRPIESVDCDGNVKRYDNARHAVRAGDAKGPGHVTSCCKGERKSHMGKTWRYAETTN